MRGMKCPWLQAATKKLMNERDFVLRKARRSGSEVDWSMYRRLRNQVSDRIKIEKRRYQRNEISDNMDKPKSFWKIMKNIFPGDKEKITTPKSIKTNDGKTVIDQPTASLGALMSFLLVPCRDFYKLLDYLRVSDCFQVENLLVNVLFCNRSLKSLF